MRSDNKRLDAEWLAVSAFRELSKIASKGDMKLSTYNGALNLGGELYPQLLGRDTSIIRRVRESDLAREYRQLAQLRSLKEKKTIDPAQLIAKEIKELKELLNLEELRAASRTRVDQLNNKLKRLVDAEKELSTEPHTENQLIFRDAAAAGDGLADVGTGRGHRDFQLPDGAILRVRVLHPDKPEHITGADIIYERHQPEKEIASVIAVQYKIWEDKTLPLTDARMKKQLARLKAFLCDNDACTPSEGESTYRFPFCAAFLKPCDKLQRPEQKLLSSGDHVPICRIDECTSYTRQRTPVLERENMRELALNSYIFEFLFNRGKIGSRMIAYPELVNLYKTHLVALAEDSVVIHAQEFREDGAYEYEGGEY